LFVQCSACDRLQHEQAGWLKGDFDGNGPIDFDDYSLISPSTRKVRHSSTVIRRREWKADKGWWLRKPLSARGRLRNLL
jgi:hypothetical protein